MGRGKSGPVAGERCAFSLVRDKVVDLLRYGEQIDTVLKPEKVRLDPLQGLRLGDDPRRGCGSPTAEGHPFVGRGQTG